MPHDHLCWEHQANRAVLRDQWKLVSFPVERGISSSNPDAGRWQLYDLKADRAEVHNLAGKHPDKVEELSAVYDKWADRVGVVLPPESKQKNQKDK